MGFAKHSNTPSLALTSHIHIFSTGCYEVKVLRFILFGPCIFFALTLHTGRLYKCTPTHSSSVCVGVLVNGCGLDPPEAGGKLPTQPL